MESAKISIASHFKSFTKKLELAHNQIAISAPVINTYLAKFQCWDCLVLYSTYNCDQLCCNCESEQTQKTCRVTQGSILGPLLFNIYVCAPKTWGQWLTWINDTITDKAKKIFAKLWTQTWILTGICTVYVLYWFTHCSFVNQLCYTYWRLCPAFGLNLPWLGNHIRSATGNTTQSIYLLIEIVIRQVCVVLLLWQSSKRGVYKYL